MKVPKPGCTFLALDVLVLFFVTALTEGAVNPSQNLDLAWFATWLVGLLIIGSLIYWALKASKDSH